ncbi:MAG: hypothetical protein QGI24_00515 [Kiritimatiellia bacterium]|jgi:hypothetical protein|nr:hypothetical protein [Kiritimatiellia bacterium]
MPEIETPQDDQSEQELEAVQEDTGSSQGETGAKSEDKVLNGVRKALRGLETGTVGAYHALKKGSARLDDSPGWAIGLIEKAMDWYRNLISEETFNKLSDVLIRCGHVGLSVVAILSPLFLLIEAVRGAGLTLALLGVGVLFLMGVLHYVADRFLKAGSFLVQSSPSKLRSAAFLDSVALLAEICGFLIFLFCVIAIPREGIGLLLLGLAIWALLDCFTYIALHPQLVNCVIAEDVNAGEEAIGILSFLVKSAVRMVPLVFGSGSIIGAIGVTAGTVLMIFGKPVNLAMGALILTIACGLLPFVAYILFVFYHLGLDILLAILSLPKKLGGTGAGD